ncbi:MAG: hypothetical protein OSA06_00635 [Acidimicrobiales bacterium]|nr:hypothetical protein [Acidimicrobiales bacterium]
MRAASVGLCLSGVLLLGACSGGEARSSTTTVILGQGPDVTVSPEETVAPTALPNDATASLTGAPSEEPEAAPSTQPLHEPMVVTVLPSNFGALDGLFTQYVSVFGVPIVATPATDPAKILHAAQVLRGYLDNDQDGYVDDPAVLSALLDARSGMMMGASNQDVDRREIWEAFGQLEEAGFSPFQELYANETAQPDSFDFALEEVHHLIYDRGWAVVYPEFLEIEDSALSEAMDLARGGHFTSVPSSYPAEAWYSYDDRTCDYGCMVTEYFYWAHTTLLGSQAAVGSERCQEISHEWRPCTPDDLRQMDPAVVGILENPLLKLPTKPPL